MADAIYNAGKAAILGDTTYSAVDLLADTIKVALVTSTYVPDIDAHHVYNDITNEVANGNGYTTGGVTLGTKTSTINDTNDRGEFDAAVAQWTGATFTARGAVIYKDTANGATSTLLAYIDFGSDQSPSNGTLTITWDANGIFTLS